MLTEGNKDNEGGVDRELRMDADQHPRRNVERIQSHAAELGVHLKTDVFESRERWQEYAVKALQTVERLAAELGVSDRLHLWPDKSLGAVVAKRMEKPKEYLEWLQKVWARISDWLV